MKKLLSIQIIKKIIKWKNKKMIKIISWNVNGIRAVIKKGFLEFIETYNPDILCIQETKAHQDQVNLDLSNYPYKFWSSAEKKGYSGTAIFSKIKNHYKRKKLNLITINPSNCSVEYKPISDEKFFKFKTKHYSIIIKSLIHC